MRHPVRPRPALQCTAIPFFFWIMLCASLMNFLTTGSAGQVPSSKIISMCCTPRAVKYVGQYSSEFSLTTRPISFSTKCVRTFLNVCEMSADGISGMQEGRLEYSGDVMGMGAICCDCGEAKARKSGETQLKSPWSTRSYRSYLRLLVCTDKHSGVKAYSSRLKFFSSHKPCSFALQTP